MKRQRCSSVWTALMLALLLASNGGVWAEEAASPAADTTTTDQQQEEQEPPKPQDTFDAKEHMDWGGYYDPQNVFCGKFDCYKILGFDYESFGSDKPDTKVITKRYRALSREWHPDKSKHRDAKERFVVSKYVFPEFSVDCCVDSHFVSRFVV